MTRKIPENKDQLADFSSTKSPWRNPKRVLEHHGISPDRAYSQNFLMNRSAVETIAGLVETEPPPALVVEFGPGVGTLTQALLARGHTLLALEKDPRMLEILHQELGSHPMLELREGDAAKTDLESIHQSSGAPPVVVGNLPYALSGAILRNLIEQYRHIDHAVLMLQREVGQRLRAQPGTKQYGALSVFAGSVFNISKELVLQPGSFFPAPKVQSEVLKFTPLSSPRACIDAEFSAIVRACFGTRRKTLSNSLAGLLGDAERASELLRQSEIDPKLRGETLTIEEFARISLSLKQTRLTSKTS